MVINSSSNEGNRILYQPIDLPVEIGRSCAAAPIAEDDETLLAKRSMPPGSYLDICSSYGWFVHQMLENGYELLG